MTVITVSARVHGDDPSPDGSPLATAVQEMFDEGYTPGPKRLQLAHKKLAAARSLSPDDRRLDYAWGLVLLRQSQPKQAAVQFEQAAEAPGAEGWRARQALIWSELVEKRFEKGLNRIIDYARHLQKLVDEAEITEEHREAARWIGEALEATDRTVQSKALHEAVARHDEKLQEILVAELYESVILGRAIVEDRIDELRKQAGIENEAQEKKEAQLRGARADKLASDLEGVSQEKANTARSADEWKKWRDEELNKVDKQLEQAERDYDGLERRLQLLQDSMIVLGRDLTALELQLNVANPAAGGLGNMRAQQMYMQRQNQMFAQQTEYNATLSRRNRTAQQGQLLMQKKTGVLQKYEKATGDLQKKSADLDRWTTRLNDKRQKLEVKPVGKGKGGKAVAADKSPPSFKSYLPLDLEAERLRMVELFSAGAESPAPGL